MASASPLSSLLTQRFPVLPTLPLAAQDPRDHLYRPQMNTQELRESHGQSLSSSLLP